MIQIIDESVLFVIFDGTEMSFNLISFAAAASPIVMEEGKFDLCHSSLEPIELIEHYGSLSVPYSPLHGLRTRRPTRGHPDQY